MRATSLIAGSTLSLLLAGSAATGLTALMSSSSLASTRTIRLSELDGMNGFRIRGEAAGDLSVTAVASGDINGDGFSDLIIGAPHAVPDGLDSGATYVL